MRAAVGVAAAAGAAGATGAAVALPWDVIFDKLLGGGGIPPPLFLLIVGGMTIALVWAISGWKKERDARDVERDENAKVINALQEKRIALGEQAILAMERTGTALTTHMAAQESRTVTINQLVKGVDDFARQEEQNRKYFEGVAVQLLTGVGEIDKMLRGR